jgi:hypothetical protein
VTLKITEKQILARQLEADLLKLYDTPMLNLNQLMRALNYSSVDAVKKAIKRGTFPVSTFMLPHRRNRYALAKYVAVYLAEQAFKKEE